MRVFFLFFCLGEYYDIIIAHFTYIAKEESANAQRYFKYIGKSSSQARSTDPKYLFDDELSCIKICDSNREACTGIDIVEEAGKRRCTFVVDGGLLKADQYTTHVTRKTVYHMLPFWLDFVIHLLYIYGA